MEKLFFWWLYQFPVHKGPFVALGLFSLIIATAIVLKNFFRYFKDNGKIIGIEPEEEYYMIDLAVRRYLMPSIPFEVEVHSHEEKYVLEIKISSQTALRPILAVEDKVSQAYIRIGDQTRPASPLLYLLWKLEKKPLTL